MVQKTSCAITFGIVALSVWSCLALPMSGGIEGMTDVLRRDPASEFVNLNTRTSGSFWANAGLVSRGEKEKRTADPHSKADKDKEKQEEIIAGSMGGGELPAHIVEHFHDEVVDPQPPLRPPPGSHWSADSSDDSVASNFDSSSDSDPHDEAPTLLTPPEPTAGSSGRTDSGAKEGKGKEKATDPGSSKSGKDSGADGGKGKSKAKGKGKAAPNDSGSGGGASDSGSSGEASGSGSSGGASDSGSGGKR